MRFSNCLSSVGLSIQLISCKAVHSKIRHFLSRRHTATLPSRVLVANGNEKVHRIVGNFLCIFSGARSTIIRLCAAIVSGESHLLVVHAISTFRRALRRSNIVEAALDGGTLASTPLHTLCQPWPQVIAITCNRPVSR